MKRILYLAMALMTLALSCGKTEEDKPAEDRLNLLEGSTSDLQFDKSGGVIPVKFVASSDWTLAIKDSWISASRTDGGKGTYTVKFTAEANPGYEDRSAEMTLSCGSIKLSFVASQPAKSHLYKVVAHRGGYLENGFAENSLSALRKTISQRCYAAECDVMWTKDNNVVICHPTNGTVNGLDPSTHTLEEIRAAGTLTDGSPMPCLEDFLSVLADKEVNPMGTKLWLDIKGNSTAQYEKVMYRSAEIAKSMNASKLVEFLVPSAYSDYVGIHKKLLEEYGIDSAWNGVVNAPSAYGANGWGQMPFSSYMQTNKYWPPTTYTDSGVRVSIYQTPSSMNYTGFYTAVFPYYEKLKAIFVNHPQDAIDHLISSGKETK